MTPPHPCRTLVRTALAVGFALALSAAATPVWAQTPDVEGLLRQGVALRRQGRDADALEEFLRAWGAAHEARVEAQIALAEQALGRWVSAVNHLEEALADSHDPWITANHAPLTESLVDIQRHVGSLRVIGGLPGAEVVVNGAHVGTLPMDVAVRVVAGTAVLEIHAPGYYDVSRQVDVPAGTEARETVDLVAVPMAGAASGTPGMPIAPTPSSAIRTVAWISLVGTGLGLAATGTGFGIRHAQVTQYNADVSCPGAGYTGQSAACQSRIDLSNSMRTMEFAGLITAGAFAVIAITLFAVPRRSAPVATVASARARPWWTGCSPSVGVYGLACQGSF